MMAKDQPFAGAQRLLKGRVTRAPSGILADLR
jgi:hypothetical protein